MAVSSPSASNPLHWVLLGNPANRRVGLFQAALRESHQPEAAVVAYRDVLNGRQSLAKVLAHQAGQRTILRIESPGEDHEVERALIARGAECCAKDCANNAAERDQREQAEVIPSASAARLRQDLGRVRHVRQWFAGYSKLLEEVEQAMASCPGLTVQNHPASIRLLYDKPRSQAFLAANAVSVPATLPGVSNYDHLREAMRQAGWSRVFAKLAHGSSASGVVAFNVSGAQPLAVTSLELVRRRGQARFYNNLKLSRYSRERDLRTIFDFLCAQGIHVEQWLPKASHAGRSFDLRVVTTTGQARHAVVRTSRTPITNLHLGNRRGNLENLKQSAGSRWRIVTSLCEEAARLIPAAQYVGWDVLVTPGFRKAYILEGNAFGDLLPSVTCAGRSTYAQAIQEILQADSSHKGTLRDESRTRRYSKPSAPNHRRHCV